MSSPATPNAEYNAGITDVTKVRAFLRGGTAVHAYIERLLGHDDEAYDLYKRLAYYLPAVPRTLDAYTGMVMTPEPLISDGPKDNAVFEEYIADMTNEGEPFQRVVYRAVEEVVATGRYCLLVDYPQVEGGQQITRLEAERMGLRPFVRAYRWEDILDWRVTVVRGRKVLSHLRLREVVDEAGANEWETKQREQVRVLDLYEGFYRVRIFKAVEQTDAGQSGRANASTSMVQEGEDIFPEKAGGRMDRIPAILVTPNSLDPSDVVTPPLLEMCDIAKSHLNDSAQRQWALQWCGSPTLVLSGLHDDDDSEIKFGSSEAIILGDGGDAKIVSLGAEGVGALKESMEEKRRDMAAVGARILADENGAQISTETARIQRAGEHSVLAGIANTVADAFTQVLRQMCDWGGIGGAEKVAVTLNTDFLPRGLQPGELGEWLGAYQMGNLPLSVLLDYLKSRGVIDPQMDEQEWNDGIDETLMPPPPTQQPANEEEDDQSEPAAA